MVCKLKKEAVCTTWSINNRTEGEELKHQHVNAHEKYGTQSKVGTVTEHFH